MGSEKLTFEVEIDLTNLKRYVGSDEDGPRYEPVTLEEAVVTETARVVADRHREFLREHVASSATREELNELIRVGLRPIVTDAINAVVHPTDAFGERTGEPRSLRDLIVERATQELRNPRERGYGNPHATLVQEIIREEVGHALGKELRDAVNKARAEVVAAVHEKGAEVLSETIAKLAGVRS